MHWWSHPVYGLNVSFGGQVHSPERHGSNLEINGTHFTYGYLCGLDRQKVFATKKEFKGKDQMEP